MVVHLYTDQYRKDEPVSATYKDTGASLSAKFNDSGHFGTVYETELDIYHQDKLIVNMTGRVVHKAIIAIIEQSSDCHLKNLQGFVERTISDRAEKKQVNIKSQSVEKENDVSNMKFTTMTISPSMAETFLKNNQNNRVKSNHQIRNYAREMKLGRWSLTAEPIMVTTDGELINGQHRLEAVIVSGMHIDFTVATVPDTSTFRVLDMGRKRSHADILGIPRSIANSLNVILKTVHEFKPPSCYDTSTLYKSYFGTLLIEIDDIVKPKGRTWGRTPIKVACALSIIIDRCDKEQAFDAYRKVCHMPMQMWPPLFMDFFRYVAEHPNPYYLTNDYLYSSEYFLRSFYCFQNLNTSRKHVVLRKSFVEGIRPEITEAIKFRMTALGSNPQTQAEA